jgi:alpha-1,2-glucosyltransferase
MLYEYTRLSLKRIIVSRNAKFTYTIILLLCIEVVHHWTYVHPFILSDNRHYVFYIWRRILSKEIFRFGLCTIYALIIVVLGRILIGILYI